MSLNDAMELIKRRRPQAQPIPAFMEMLKQYEGRMIKSSSSSSSNNNKRNSSDGVEEINNNQSSNDNNNNSQQTDQQRKRPRVVGPSRPPSMIGPSAAPKKVTSPMTTIIGPLPPNKGKDEKDSSSTSNKSSTSLIGPAMPPKK